MNMAYSNISVTELDKTSRELINDFGIQEIHQLVAELDSGVKHSESKICKLNNGLKRLMPIFNT